ncbi:helix-turn-helix domain-containing protein, partial [Rhodococcus sp. IEGM1300]
KLRGKTVRIAREVRNIKLQDLADMTGIARRYLASMEREASPITQENEIRILRGLRKHTEVTDSEIIAIQIIVENAEGKFDKWKR